MSNTDIQGGHDHTVQSLAFVSDLTKQALAPQTLEVDGVTMLVSDGKVTDLTALAAPFQAGPRRIQTGRAVVTVPSFALYVKEFATPSTILIGSIKNACVKAVIDYHSKTMPGWCEHSVTLVSERMPEWLAFKARNGQYVAQVEFAQFLDRFAGWVTEPDAAVLAESIMQLEGSNNTAWQSKVNRSNGAFTFSVQEDVLTNVKIPSQMTLAIKPFYHSQTVTVVAKIRFKISKEGAPSFAVEIDNIEQIEYQALLETFGDVEEATGMKVLIGP